MKTEYYRNNVDGTRYVAAAAADIGVPVVFSSSAAVYGNSREKVSETSMLSPLSPYAENKRDGEMLLAQAGARAVVLRYFNVFGPRQSSQYAGVISIWIARALANEDIVIYGTGSQVRDFVFIDDVVAANIAAMNLLQTNPAVTFEVFNIGSGVQTTISELAQKIIELTGSQSKITYAPAREGDIEYSAADVSRAKDILQFEAKVSLHDGLKRTIEYFASQKNS